MTTGEVSRKDAILAATISEVVSHGIDGASTKSIAEAAGVSNGLVLYHFKTKEELIAAAWMASVRHFYTRSTDMAGTSAGLRRIAESFRIQFVDRDAETPPWSFWLELWAKASRSPGLRKLHSERLTAVRASYTAGLAEGIAAGEISPDLDPELLGDLFHALIYGLAVKVTLDSEIISSERALAIGNLVIDLVRKASTNAHRSSGDNLEPTL